MRHFLQYWKEKQNDTDIGTILDQAESAQFRRVRPNDVLWIVTLIDRKLTLLGRIVVGKVDALREPESLFWSGPADRFEVIAKKGTEMKSIQADIQAIAPELRFNSERDRLILYNRSRTDGKQLQILRELSSGTVRQLQNVLELKVKRKIAF